MDYEYIVVETDEENPTTIATITNENIDCIKGYRVRVKPMQDYPLGGKGSLPWLSLDCIFPSLP